MAKVSQLCKKNEAFVKQIFQSAFLHYPADIASTVALCKKLQLFLRLGKRLSVHTDIGTATSPAQTESKKLEFLLCEDTGHLALFRVHFQLQPAF